MNQPLNGLAKDWQIESFDRSFDTSDKAVEQKKTSRAKPLPSYGKHVNIDRFAAIWTRLLCEQILDSRLNIEYIKADIERIYTDLFGRYNETHRRYHTAGHIDHCLHQIDLARSSFSFSCADVVELAIWFHDAVYQPSANDNERRSVELFNRCANGVLRPEVVDSVERLIMVTVHDQLPKTDDEKFVVDVDLSSFGQQWNDFWRDSIAVRLEQIHQEDQVFSVMQRAFLVRLLDRQNIFSSDYFRDRYEQQARSNIRTYLAQLLMGQSRAAANAVSSQ